MLSKIDLMKYGYARVSTDDQKADLQKRGVVFLFLTEAIDTENTAGRLIGHRSTGGV